MHLVIQNLCKCILGFRICANAGEHDGFDEAYGPDDDPAPNPEDQRLPAPHEQPGAHHKKEPIAPADDGECGT